MMQITTDPITTFILDILDKIDLSFVILIITIVCLGVLYYIVQTKKFKLFNKNIVIKDVLSNQADLNSTMKMLFMDAKMVERIEHELVILIINNNFIIDFPIIITFFKNNYDFSVDEFVLLNFKLGMAARAYIDDPIALLKHALALEGVFTTDIIKKLKAHLKDQIASDKEDLIEKYKAYNNELNAEEELKPADNITDAEANIFIDKWKNKNKN